MSFEPTYIASARRHSGKPKRQPTTSLMDLSRETGISYSAICHAFSKTGNLDVVFTRKLSKYYNRKELLAWAKENLKKYGGDNDS